LTVIHSFVDGRGKEKTYLTELFRNLLFSFICVGFKTPATTTVLWLRG